LPYASTHADELSIARPGVASPKYTRVALGKYNPWTSLPTALHSLPCNNAEPEVDLAG
jgi:hypothetical protein